MLLNIIMFAAIFPLIMIGLMAIRYSGKLFLAILSNPVALAIVAILAYVYVW